MFIWNYYKLEKRHYTREEIMKVTKSKNKGEAMGKLARIGYNFESFTEDGVTIKMLPWDITKAILKGEY